MVSAARPRSGRDQTAKNSFGRLYRTHRLAERGVRFIQLCHRDWDHHSDLPKGIRTQAKNTDPASAALVADLKQRGLLDGTLVF